ncbi:isochorismatase family protein [Roseisalinus antarcticus]|uniref:Maleamate amidohydrolase n=1 Tax=Roseisalinus antarcticus TaxID=254357 RepID=A0A1Y5RUC9_9RHOB|nr:isochorismatase family protein [Roseisalinus antarcticus]SLN25581.1 Maleamate amidohydrolase [Roseisalinus antarcticus]
MPTETDLGENYRRAYGNRIGFGKRPALILIDFVEAYFDPSCELYAGVETALASALRVREAARANGVPVIYTNVVYQPDGRDGGRFFQKALPLRNFIAGSPMGAWPQGLTVDPGETVISKQYPSAFFGTSLAPMLASAGIDTLVHTGLSTSGCVRATCVDSCSHGFIPIIVRDAVGDRHPAPHEANLFDMDAKYGDVVGEADIIDYFNTVGAAE